MIFKTILLLSIISLSNSTCTTENDTSCHLCFMNLCGLCYKTFYNILTGKCESVTTTVEFCDYYNSPTGCEVCQEGYYSKDGKCVVITTENCAFAKKDVGECESCKNSKKMDFTTKKCTDVSCTIANCLYCTMDSETQENCVMCQTGYKAEFSFTGSTCVKSSDHCMATIPLFGGCARCEKGYFMKGAECFSISSTQKLGYIFFLLAILL